MPPITVMIKPVSGLCNMKCNYCFYVDEMNLRNTSVYEPMTLKTLENIVRRVFAYADKQVAFVFQGGEPTLAGIDFYWNFLALQRKYNSLRLPVTNAIQTNGLILTEEWIELFKIGSFLLGVSVDGTQEFHDEKRVDHENNPTYHKILQNISLLKKENIPYNILCVVDQRIATSPKKVFETLSSHNYLQFIPRIDSFSETTDENSLSPKAFGKFLIWMFDIYAQKMKQGSYISIRMFDNWMNMAKGFPPESCGLSGKCNLNFLIESNGNVYPCDFYGLDEWLLGNINEASFFRLEKSPVVHSFLKSSLSISSKCKACHWYSLCRGGCRRDRESATQGKLQHNRLCEGYLLFFSKRGDQLVQLANNQK